MPRLRCCSDRQRTIEQLLAERGSLTLADIENYDPGIEDMAERNAWQQGFLKRVYYIFEQDAEQLALNQDAPERLVRRQGRCASRALPWPAPSAPASACSSATRARSASSPVASICAASRPALVALSIATVATGTPGGHLYDRQAAHLRLPCSVALIGTPMTGSGLIDATMPGRCAAPPAPAMTTRRPRASACCAYSYHALRGAVRTDDGQLVGYGQLVENRRRFFHDRQVRVAAHDDANECVHAASWV